MAIAGPQILNDHAEPLKALEKSEIDSPDVRVTLESASNLARLLEAETDAARCMADIVERVELRDDGISVTLKIQVPCSRAGVQNNSILNLSRFVPLKMKRRGVETRITIAAGADLPRRLDSALLKAVAPAGLVRGACGWPSAGAVRDRTPRGCRPALRRTALAFGVRCACHRGSDLPGSPAR